MRGVLLFGSLFLSTLLLGLLAAARLGHLWEALAAGSIIVGVLFGFALLVALLDWNDDL